MTLQIRKAERRQAKLRLGLTGPSGSGKTYSAVVLSRGLVGPEGKILFVDTENGSGELYSNLTEYDYATITPPYTTEKYIEAIHAAEDAGYDVLILDSISHAWNGEGGLLEQKDMAAKRPGVNSYTVWGDITPLYNRFVETILASKVHIIATMRSKTDYVMTENDKGKLAPQKVGLAPIQREGMDYELTIVLDIDKSHIATASKDRTGLFDGKMFVIDSETGEQIRRWQDGATAPEIPRSIQSTPSAPVVKVQPSPAPVKQPAKPRPTSPATQSEVDDIRKRYQEEGFSEAIFESARWTDGVDELWDKDTIQADWKQRINLKNKQNVAATPAPTPEVTQVAESVCPKCGGKPMSDTQRKDLLTMLGTDDDSLPPHLCRACGKLILNAAKEEVKQEPVKATPKPKEYPKVCADCGKLNVLASDDKISIPKYGVSLCPKCYKARLQAAIDASNAAKTTDTQGYVCSVCGAEITKVQKDTCDLFGTPIMCKDCEKKTDGGAA